MKILLEMRPALDGGYAGIPQETRLLFYGLSRLEGVSVEGLIQSSNRVLARGLPHLPGSRRRAISEDRRVDRLARVVISLQQRRPGNWLVRSGVGLERVLAPAAMMARTLLGRREPMTRFEPARFRDFVWRSLFAKTLPTDDFDAVTSGQFRVARVPWSAMHAGGLVTRKLGHAVYPRLDTAGFDVMIAETPYPGRVGPNTRLVVRYHDAIPLLMPHTISDKAYHQASHYHALQRNVRDGAWFACVSEATRQDLLSIFPQAEPRAVTIHNMVSHHYFAEDSSPRRIGEILRLRAHTTLRPPPRIGASDALSPDSGASHRPGVSVDARPSQRAQDRLGASGKKAHDYLLMVSTVEPRKNHLTLLAAWEQLRAEHHAKLELVVVGMLGWDHEAIVQKFRPWIERGALHVLEDVPSAELRLLYRHAAATVCPSFGEGFDFSGVEAMRSGGAVVASDIPVHRDIYRDGALYFNPYSPPELAAALLAVIDPAAMGQRRELVERGQLVAADYQADKILPQWREFLLGLDAG